MKIKPYFPERETELSQQELKEMYKNAKNFGEIRLGEDRLFYRTLFRNRFLSLRDCDRIYLRVELGEYGDFPLHEHYIMVETKDGKSLQMRLERPVDAKGVLEELKERNLGILLGKK